jgi:hypothetical protein
MDSASESGSRLAGQGDRGETAKLVGISRSGLALNRAGYDREASCGERQAQVDQFAAVTAWLSCG